MDRITVIVTTKSNMKNILRLTNSLYPFYKQLYEFIIVDAGTPNLKDSSHYTLIFPRIIKGEKTTRGEGKNIGLKKATGDIIVFFDDDVEIDKNYFKELRKSIKHSDIVAGYSPNPIGKDMPRVPVYVKGQDITYPTCNIAYRRKVTDKIGYFKKELITAEDIEYNCRCVKSGFTITYNPKMIVYHYHRTTLKGFAKQAFWNGYGRRQFNRIHKNMSHIHGFSPKGILRLGFGFLGYILGDLFNDNRNT